MNNELKILNIGGVDCYEQNGVAYLKLDAVARGLGFTQVKNGVEYVKWERVNRYLNEMGFSPQVGKADIGIATSCDGKLPEFIPENVFYRLAMKAKNEVAEKFQAKVADEIIPSIRKHGAYMTAETLEAAMCNPDFILKLATQLKAESDARKAAEAKAKQLEDEAEANKPTLLLGTYVETAETSIPVGDFSKILKQNGINIGKKRLYEWLRQNGYLISRWGDEHNMPTQYAMELGLFEIKETPYATAQKKGISKKPMVTGKGQTYFVNKFNKIKEVKALA